MTDGGGLAVGVQVAPITLGLVLLLERTLLAPFLPITENFWLHVGPGLTPEKLD